MNFKIGKPRLILLTFSMSLLGWSQHELPDLSNCEEANTEKYKRELAAEGYQLVKVTGFRLTKTNLPETWRDWGGLPNNQKATKIFRYQNGDGDIRYATCFGIRGTPMRPRQKFLNGLLEFHDYYVDYKTGDDLLLFHTHLPTTLNSPDLLVKRVAPGKWRDYYVNSWNQIEMDKNGIPSGLLIMQHFDDTGDNRLQMYGTIRNNNRFVRMVSIVETADGIRFEDVPTFVGEHKVIETITFEQGEAATLTLMNRTSFPIDLNDSRMSGPLRTGGGDTADYNAPSDIIAKIRGSEKTATLKLRRQFQGPQN